MNIHPLGAVNIKKHTPRMKRYSLILLLIAAISAAMPAAARRINPLARMAIDELTDTTAAARRSPRIHGTIVPDEAGHPYIPVLMMIDPNSRVLHQMDSLGVVIYNHRGHIYMCGLPLQSAQDVQQLEGIVDISAATIASCTMDKAREFSFVDAVQSGKDLPRAYDGTGVVAGFSDIGFDPNHIAFKDHVASVANFSPELDESTIAATPQAISQWTTDHAFQTHATHVANILAGSYTGNPYHGVAPGATIVATTSGLNDVGILQGVEHIISYAKEHDMPAVINLSLSSFTGPHDGTSLMAQYLNAAGEDAAICISSGNNGAQPTYCDFTATADRDSAMFEVGSSSDWTHFRVYGYVDLWSLDSTPLRTRAWVYDNSADSLVCASPWLEASNDSVVVFSPEQFNGHVKMASYISPLNGRYNVTVSASYTTDAVSTHGEWARYNTVIEVQTAPGNTVYAYPDASPVMVGHLPAHYSNFRHTSNGCVNDMATCENVTCVGSSNSRNSATTSSGLVTSWGFDTGRTSNFSSYASATPLCRALPDICAPGNMVVSAASSPYVKSTSDFTPLAHTDVDGKTYYWYAECGTSMASPHVAGVYALWLQADPSLTPSQLRDIAQSTARTDYVDFPSAQWNKGEIDAAAGLKQILAQVTALPGMSADQEDDTVTAIYTLSGASVGHTDTSRLSPGIYIISTPSGSKKVKF